MDKELPLTVRRSIELAGLYILGLILVAGSGIITPIILSFLISIVMLPVFKFFLRMKLGEALSIFFSLLLLAGSF